MKFKWRVLRSILIDEISQPLFLKVEEMSAKIDALSAAIAVLTPAVTAAIQNEQALKVALDAAIAANVTLKAQLVEAQGAAMSASDAAAIDSAAVAIGAASQALADATAVNSPSN